MRFNPELFDIVKSGFAKPSRRVTVDPSWSLKTTAPIYGNSFKGPFRYYTTYDASAPSPLADEYEVPSVQSVSWNRSTTQDLGSCTITIYNSWHNLNNENPELAGTLGKKGYFWPKRGQGDSFATWNQRPGRGAYRKDGSWNPTFSWENVLVEDALIRTYEGYNCMPSQGNYPSIDTGLEDGQLMLTGVWIVNSVTAGADGMMTLDCTDIGRVLLDQIVFPPTVPGGVYPLEYYPPGKSAFDSPWGPKLADKEVKNELGQVVSTSPADRGKVWVRNVTSTGSSDGTISNHGPLRASDGDWDTYSLSEAYQTIDGGRPYWEFFLGDDPDEGAKINALQLKTWAGGYTVYVSISEDVTPGNSASATWKGGNSIPGGGIRYVHKVEIPMYIPDGMEYPINIDLPELKDVDDLFDRVNDPDIPRNTYFARKVRLTFENLYYSHIPNGSSHRYRAGIRDISFYRDGLRSSAYAPIGETTPWTFAIEQHPTRGYWVADINGNVYGFGDAQDYDSDRFGQVPIWTYGDTNRIVGIAAHPSGEGYWVVDWFGHVWAYGAATDYGEHVIPNPFSEWGQQLKTQVKAIASTYTGNGYWVVYSNGVVRGFGDASPSIVYIPQTPVATFMDAFLKNNYPTGTYIPYNIGLKATGIAAHPHKMGFWVTDGSGQVFAYGACAHHGELKERVYRPGLAGRFKLGNLDWAAAIESTPSGDGYWIVFASRLVASFGDAVSLGKDPFLNDDLVPIYPENVIYDDDTPFSNEAFKYMLWGIARDPSGKGFWALAANGEVIAYDAEFWGQPGYTGLTGYRWHEGNFNGDYKDIVSDILKWGGFLFYQGDLNDDETPAVYGNLESTGIFTDTSLSGDKFDKKTLLDVIKEFTEVVGYRFYISEEGRAIYASPNWWRAGNFDQNGLPIYVDESGERVDPESEGANPFIPVIHESEDLLSYSVTLSTTDKRSEIIIGTDIPDPKDPTRTGYVIHYPPSALETVTGGVSAMRGIERPAIWVSSLFENEEERKLMAEMIGLHAWFSSRVGSATIQGNPCLSIDDQIRIVEKNTSETFIHLITGINSTNSDDGTYTMGLTTHWLGTADDWVIKNTVEDSEYIYTVISNNLNSWQVKTNRGLGSGGGIDNSFVTASGSFNSAIGLVESLGTMVVLGDSLSSLDSSLDWTTNDHWPNLLVDAGLVDDLYNGAMLGYTSQDLIDTPIVEPEDIDGDIDVLVIFVGANDQKPASGVSVAEYEANLQTLISLYPANKTVIVFPWRWEPDEPLFFDYQTAALNVALENDFLSLSLGKEFLYLGLAQELAAIGADRSDYVVDDIHASALGHEFIADSIVNEIGLTYQEVNGWSFEGTMEIFGQFSNLKLSIDSISNLGHSIYLEIFNSEDDLVFASSLISNGQELTFGPVTHTSVNTYRMRVTGVATQKGTGNLKISLLENGQRLASVQDTIIFLEG